MKLERIKVSALNLFKNRWTEKIEIKSNADHFTFNFVLKPTKRA